MAGEGELVSEKVDILQEQFPDCAGAELVSVLAATRPRLPAVDNFPNLQLQSDPTVVEARHVLQPDGGVEQLHLNPHDDTVDGLGQQLHTGHHVLLRAPAPGLPGAGRHVLRLETLLRHGEGGETLAHRVKYQGGDLGRIGSLLDLDSDGEAGDREVAALCEQVGPWYCH